MKSVISYDKLISLLSERSLIKQFQKNFEKVHSTFPKNNKFRFLPNWLEKESNLFLSETQNTSKSYNVLKRGSLIFVDFGINIGSELSNRHWAVVLNKNDYNQ